MLKGTVTPLFGDVIRKLSSTSRHGHFLASILRVSDTSSTINALSSSEILKAVWLMSKSLIEECPVNISSAGIDAYASNEG